MSNENRFNSVVKIHESKVEKILYLSTKFMKHILFISLLLLLTLKCLYGQNTTPITIGVNFAPLILGGIEVKTEIPLIQSIAIQAGISGRHQNTNIPSEYPIKNLATYIHTQNSSLSLQTGLRFADHYAEYYPYASVDMVTSLYHYNYLSRQNLQEISKGITIGGSISVGFVAQLWRRLYLDIALQTGGSAKLRNSPDNFYLSGMGYNLKGATESPFLQKMTVQPIVMLKYVIGGRK